VDLPGVPAALRWTAVSVPAAADALPLVVPRVVARVER
jgi:hypothetical protein